jgi:hypothetical protein
VKQVGSSSYKAREAMSAWGVGYLTRPSLNFEGLKIRFWDLVVMAWTRVGAVDSESVWDTKGIRAWVVSLSVGYDALGEDSRNGREGVLSWCCEFGMFDGATRGTNTELGMGEGVEGLLGLEFINGNLCSLKTNMTCDVDFARGNVKTFIPKMIVAISNEYAWFWSKSKFGGIVRTEEWPTFTSKDL